MCLWTYNQRTQLSILSRSSFLSPTHIIIYSLFIFVFSLSIIYTSKWLVVPLFPNGKQNLVRNHCPSERFLTSPCSMPLLLSCWSLSFMLFLIFWTAHGTSKPQQSNLIIYGSFAGHSQTHTNLIPKTVAVSIAKVWEFSLWNMRSTKTIDVGSLSFHQIQKGSRERTVPRTQVKFHPTISWTPTKAFVSFEEIKDHHLVAIWSAVG